MPKLNGKMVAVFAVTVVLLLSLSFHSAADSQTTGRAGVTWEYRVLGPVEINNLMDAKVSQNPDVYKAMQARMKATQTRLNQLGDEGWEFVSTWEGGMILKRPRNHHAVP